MHFLVFFSLVLCPIQKMIACLLPRYSLFLNTSFFVMVPEGCSKDECFAEKKPFSSWIPANAQFFWGAKFLFCLGKVFPFKNSHIFGVMESLQKTSPSGSLLQKREGDLPYKVRILGKVEKWLEIEIFRHLFILKKVIIPTPWSR